MDLKQASDHTVVCCHEGQERMVKLMGVSAVTMSNSKPQNWRRQEKSPKGLMTALLPL